MVEENSETISTNPEVQEKNNKEGKSSEESSPSKLDEAKALAERLEKANQRHEELINREESLAAERIVSGQAEAGSIPEKPKEMSDEEYSKKALAGELNENV